MCLSHQAAFDILVNFVDGRILDGYAKQLDSELAEFNPELVDDVLIAGILAATYEYSEELPSRQLLLKRAKDHLVKVYGGDRTKLNEIN
jgi:predicted transcriptional regulator